MSAIVIEKVCPVFYMPLKTVMKVCGSVVFVVFLLVPCVYYLDGGVKTSAVNFRENNSNLLASKKEKDMKIKTILYWTGMFDSDTFWFGKGDVFKNCEVSACRATTDRNLINPEEFDAVLFHGVETRLHDLPSRRSNDQKYIFILLESPAMYSLDSAYLPDQFYNWTMTYRRDSDIPRPYGHIRYSATNEIAYPTWARNPNHVSNDQLYETLRYEANNVVRFEGKRKTAAWFASHCKTPSHRGRYVDELQNYIEVDVYGDCGPLYCKPRSSKCYDMLESRYYFYISFENSLCDDYVTEKLYKILSYNVVPVVYGAVNYTEYAPPGSYINVADFKSPKHLAEHLDHLINNPDEYAKYFWWKKHFSIDLSHRPTICQMCEMLHNEKSLAPSHVLDVKKWWTKGVCHNSSEYLNKIIPLNYY